MMKNGKVNVVKKRSTRWVIFQAEESRTNEAEKLTEEQKVKLIIIR